MSLKKLVSPIHLLLEALAASPHWSHRKELPAFAGPVSNGTTTVRGPNIPSKAF